MPYKKIPCPICGLPMSHGSKTCRSCAEPYERTPERRQHMSNVTKGKPKPWLRGKSRPEHSKRMFLYWTEERREEKRQAMLLLNPSARYHGLSCKGARRIREALGHCEICGSDGSDSRLDVHHKNGDKKDQSMSNLVVLCHRCHMKIHGERAETGFDSMWRKRKSCSN